jgi:hypothetical protein
VSLAKRVLSCAGGGSLQGCPQSKPRIRICYFQYFTRDGLSNANPGFSACIGLLLSAPSNNGSEARAFTIFSLHIVHLCYWKFCNAFAGQRMAEFIILAATAAIVSLPSRLLSVCLLRYLKDDHLRSGLSFSPWPKILSVCGVSVALAAACSCFLVFMVPSWTAMLLRSLCTPNKKN